MVLVAVSPSNTLKPRWWSVQVGRTAVGLHGRVLHKLIHEKAVEVGTLLLLLLLLVCPLLLLHSKKLLLLLLLKKLLVLLVLLVLGQKTTGRRWRLLLLW